MSDTKNDDTMPGSTNDIVPAEMEMENTADVEQQDLDNGKPTSNIKDKRLWRFNLACAILHGIQGVLLLAASQAVPSIKAFKKDITIAYQEFQPDTQGLATVSRSVSNVEIGAMAAVFLLMSSAAHAICLLRFKSYIAEINRGINVVRWYEYALSSSVMMIAIAGLFGCYDLASIVLIFLVNASMNLFGLLMERMNPPGTKNVNWEPFIFGCVSGIAPWIAVGLYFFGSPNPESFESIPPFVYGILASYFVFFQSFPVNMWLQYAKIGIWKDYRVGEMGYMVLSLASKTLLAWLVFGGTFQPNGDD